MHDLHLPGVGVQRVRLASYSAQQPSAAVRRRISTSTWGSQPLTYGSFTRDLAAYAGGGPVAQHASHLSCIANTSQSRGHALQGPSRKLPARLCNCTSVHTMCSGLRSARPPHSHTTITTAHVPHYKVCAPFVSTATINQQNTQLHAPNTTPLSSPSPSQCHSHCHASRHP